MTAATAFRAERVRGIVFDLDGTLVDGYEGIAIAVNAARASFGLPLLAIDDVRGRVGLGLSHLMEDVLGAERAAAGAVIFRKVYDRVCVEQTRSVPALDTTLATLGARGYRLAVASNKPVAYSNRILDRLGVRALFDAIEGPETAGSLKPDPAMIRACLLAMALEAPHAVYVGDMPLDAAAADAAGVPVLLVAGGSSSAYVLENTGRPVLGALVELLDVLPGKAPS